MSRLFDLLCYHDYTKNIGTIIVKISIIVEIKQKKRYNLSIIRKEFMILHKYHIDFMNIGIVILNYNDSQTTIDLLMRVQEFKNLNSIVVVDNNSTDDSYKELINYSNDKIKIIRAAENNGYSYGNNIGCQYLSKKNVDYIIVSNPDVVFSEEDINKLIESFSKNTAIVAPTIQEGDFLNRGWKFPSVFIDGMSNINYIGRKFKRKILYSEEYYKNNYSKVDVVSGCFFIIKREVFDKIEGFDENVFLYYEESMISKKIEKIGKDIIVNNKVQIVHKHSVSIDKSIGKIKKFKILTKSQRYYHKNYNNANTLQILFLHVTCFIAITISYLLSLFKHNKKS